MAPEENPALTTPQIRYTRPDGSTLSAHWLSEAPIPKRLQVVDDSINADAAFHFASEGTAMLWQGDFQNARQLLQAMGRRLDKRKAKVSREGTGPAAEPELAKPPTADDFHRYRMAQAQRARTLGQLLIPMEKGFTIPLRRAPDVGEACSQALGKAPEGTAALPLRDLLGIIGAYEWRKNGVKVPALDAAIHPHYGVFAPVRGEYVELVAQTPLPARTALAFDIGTGTGVLAAVLAKRGIKRIIATDTSARALACASDNIQRLGLSQTISIASANLFPTNAPPADLIVCNPPWLPGKAGSLLEQAVYDPDSRMLRGFLAGLRMQLDPRGEAWLILSDIAEHLGVRSRDQLLGWLGEAGVRVIERIDTRPTHGKTQDASDPLHLARAAEITSLWRLALI